MNEVPIKIDELDPPFAIDETAPAYRRKMPTIRDFGPPHDDARPRNRLRRDSLPTLPDIDPLRHDLPS